MDIDALLQTAALREGEGNPGVAETLYRLVLDFEPRHAVAALCLARALQQRGAIEDAIAAYSLALSGDPFIPSALLERAGAYERIQRLDEAIVDCQAYLVHRPQDVSTHLAVGRLLAASGEIDVALRYFRQAMALDPNDPQIPCLAGNACMESYLFDDAERFFAMALKLAPELSGAEFSLGMVALEQRRFTDLIRHMKRVLTMPDHEAHRVSALKYIAAFSALGGVRTQREMNQAAERWRATLGPRSPSPPLPEECANLTLNQLRLGIVSDRLGTNPPHPQDRLAALLSASFERLGVTCFVYAIENRQSSIIPPEWRDLRHTSTERIAAAIRQDRCHALITLDLISMANGRLYLEPLAPLVASWLHGLASHGGLVDAIISDAWLIPPDEDAIFVEKILRLPDGVLSGLPNLDGPPPAPPPCLKRGYVTFGSLNRPNKIDDDAIALWSQAGHLQKPLVNLSVI